MDIGYACTCTNFLFFSKKLFVNHKTQYPKTINL